ncbi:MAG: hypothetical protein B5M52_01650 [Helicobacteraceae bacterium 4484_230]|nr:MAG: hypothetical protein B5M52_01650 [Helicobacteraceae bacterium 4484_230]
MRKILSLCLFAVMLTLFYTGCAPRPEYKPSVQKSNRTLLYVYCLEAVKSSDYGYEIRVNDMTEPLILRDNGYLVFELDSKDISISAQNSDDIAGVVDRDTIVLKNVKKGKSYYVKAIISEGEKVDLVAVDSLKAQKEIKNTVLYDQEENTYHLFVNDTDKVSGPAVIESDTASSSVAGSDAQEIEKLYELKEKGVISDDEFRRLKKKIIEK